MHRQNEYCRRPTLIIHYGGAVHDYIHTGIVLIELLLHKGHLEHILLLIRCRSGADNEEAYPKYAQISKNVFVCYGYSRSYRYKTNKKNIYWV